MENTSKRFAGLVALSAMVACCSCSSPSVEVGRDPRADFSHYRTYAWLESNQTPKEGIASTLDAEVKASTAREIAAKGLKETPASSADLLISYSAVTRQDRIYGMPPGPWYWGSSDEAFPTREGSLTLQFWDRSTHRSLWQGTALDVMGDRDVIPGQLPNAIKKLIKKYPEA